MMRVRRFTAFPDDKGTEMIVFKNLESQYRGVSPPFPMTRGLKLETEAKGILTKALGFTAFPDDKGTEMSVLLPPQWYCLRRFTAFPDDKGTEIKDNVPY